MPNLGKGKEFYSTSDLRSKVGCISEIKINLNLFCISLDLDNFLTLKNENKCSFSSLTRNFALPLHPLIYINKV